MRQSNTSKLNENSMKYIICWILISRNVFWQCSNKKLMKISILTRNRWKIDQMLIQNQFEIQFLLIISESFKKSKTAWISSLVINNNFNDKLEAFNLSLILLYSAAYLLQESSKWAGDWILVLLQSHLSESYSDSLFK